MKLITNAKELQQILLDLGRVKLDEPEGKIIIDYLEEYEYEILTDDKNLFLADIIDQTDINIFSLNEIVEIVKHWNNELIREIEKNIEQLYVNLDQHEEFEKLMNHLLNLKDDKIKLAEISI